MSPCRRTVVVGGGNTFSRRDDDDDDDDRTGSHCVKVAIRRQPSWKRDEHEHLFIFAVDSSSSSGSLRANERLQSRRRRRVLSPTRSMMDAVLYSTAAVAITRISATEAYCVRVLLLLPLPLKVTSEEPLLACKTPKLSALNSVWNYFTMLILRFNGFRTSNSGHLTANTRHVQRE